MPDTKTQLLDRAARLFGAGDIEAAAGLFEQVLTLDPDCARSWSDLGAVRFALGDIEGARSALRSALEAAPDHLDAILNMARLESASGSPTEAAPLARRARTLAPDDPETAAMLASLGLENDDRPSALLLDWNRTLRGRRPTMRAILEEHGYRPRTLARDVTEALARIWDIDEQAAVLRVIDAVAPALVILEPDTALGHQALEDRGIPHLTLDADAPNGIDPAIDHEALVSIVPQRLADLPPATSRAPITTDPVISLIVPTYERQDCLRNLLDRLALQDFPPQLFEVIVVDDGSEEPVTSWLEEARPPFALTLRHQENAGPARARNVAIAEARADLLLILNDDALPALDVVRRHVVGQGNAERPVAILGSFDFDERACEDPFTDLMQHSNLLFEYGAMTPGALHSGRFFWTCNLSVPTKDVRAVNGFDEAFRHAICEDCDLGHRLESERGISVLYDPRIRSDHDHDMSLDRYLKRQQRLGFYQNRMFEKHPQTLSRFIAKGVSELTDNIMLFVRKRFEHLEPRHASLLAEARSLLAEAARHRTGTPERKAILKKLIDPVSMLSMIECFRGMIDERWGPEIHEPEATSLLDQTTSIIIPNLNGFPHVKGCIASLREHTTGPWELIIVDNGSTDGSLEWLRAQPDVTLLEMGENIGAPAARNAGLQVATGASVTFCDNDVIFTPKWRDLLVGHLQAWPDVGAVGPKSDYVSGSQKTLEAERGKESLSDFARRFTEEHKGEHHYTSRLILFFMVCRRDLIDRIGGIDPIYGRWGFEDDDLCLRARVAGAALRVAEDCFIRHLGSRTSKTANIDYNALLVENFEVFKKKWRLPEDLAYGDPIEVGPIIARGFDRDRDYVPLTAGVPRTAMTGV